MIHLDRWPKRLPPFFYYITYNRIFYAFTVNYSCVKVHQEFLDLLTFVLFVKYIVSLFELLTFFRQSTVLFVHNFHSFLSTRNIYVFVVFSSKCQAISLVVQSLLTVLVVVDPNVFANKHICICQCSNKIRVTTETNLIQTICNYFLFIYNIYSLYDTMVVFLSYSKVTHLGLYITNV